MLEAALGEIGKTVRYVVATDARTARLTALMLIAVIVWHYML